MTTIFYHRGCCDGHAALGLLLRALGGEPTLYSVPANLSNFPDLPDGKGTAYFVDCCPTEPMIEVLERAFFNIHILDHHLSSQAFCAAVAERPGWTVHHAMDRCATQIVRDVYALEGVDTLVDMTAKFDLWTDPSNDTFRWMLAASALWERITGRSTTTPALARAYIDELASKSVADMNAGGERDMEMVYHEYNAASVHELQLGEASEAWDGRALVLVLDSVSQPSILLHWLLRDHAEFKVAIGVWRKKFADSFSCSLRSVDGFDITAHVPWARGHAQAAGGMIDADVFLTAHKLGEKTESSKRARVEDTVDGVENE